jgi:hypothetical protein
MDRLRTTFGDGGVNASDWYFPSSGLSVLTANGVCNTTTSLCTAGNVGAPCTTNANCTQSVSLDSSALSVGLGRRDIENLTQASQISIPVIGVGGSNGLTPVGASYSAFAQSIGPCTAASCSGSTPRLVDASLPSPAFPTYGGVAGGFEVVIVEGFAHVDVISAQDVPGNPVIQSLSDFIERNAP